MGIGDWGLGIGDWGLGDLDIGELTKKLEYTQPIVERNQNKIVKFFL